MFLRQSAVRLVVVLAFSIIAIPLAAAPREPERAPDPDTAVVRVVKRAIKKLLPPKIVTILDDTMSVPKP
jgi:hypothetical protein